MLAGDGIAQRATQPVENGGLEQEAAHPFGLTLEDLGDEIVHDVPVVAGESLDEPGNVRAPPHGERRQLEPGNPAFGARLQGGNFRRRELQPHHLVEKAGGFGGGKAQVGGAQLGHLAPGAQASQGELWILPGGDDQVQLGRQVVEQKGEGLVDRWGIDGVVVVQDEGKGVREGGDFIEQGRQQHFGCRRLGGLEHAQHPCAKFRPKPFGTLLRASVCKAATR